MTDIATQAPLLEARKAATQRLKRLDALWPSVLVLATWLVMTMGAWSYVSTYASRVPMWDDIDLVPLIDPDANWTPKELWGLHNEHRLPLPRMIEAELFAVTGDIRTPMYGEVVLLSGIALASILVVRGLRGRTRAADALFPLMWLHTGNCENLLMGFQISIVLPMVVVCGLLLFLLTRPHRGLRPWEADVSGVCLASLPLCGGQGMAQMPLLFVMCAGFAYVSWRSADPRLRLGGKWMAGWLAITALLAAAYVVGFRYPAHSTRTLDPVVVLGGALRAGSLTLGLAGPRWWPWSGVILASFVVATGVLFVQAWKRRVGERLRLFALITTFGSGVLLLMSIGFGRAGGGEQAAFSSRYIPMPGPLILAGILAWILYGPRAWGRIVPGALALAVLVANVYVNTPMSVLYGTERRDLSQKIEADVHNGMMPGTFMIEYAGKIHPTATRLHVLVWKMANLRVPPFDDVSEATRALYAWTMTNLPPVRVDSKHPPVPRKLDGTWPVLLVPTDCALHFDVPADLVIVRAAWGLPSTAVARGRTKGARLVVTAAGADGAASTVLYERSIDPVHVPGDLGPLPMRATIPPDLRHVVFEFHGPEEDSSTDGWAFLGDVSFEPAAQH